MTAISRRNLLTQILPGAAVAAAGVATVGWTIAPESADALPLGIAGASRVEVDELVEKVQMGSASSSSPHPGPPPPLLPAPALALLAAVGNAGGTGAVASAIGAGADRHCRAVGKLTPQRSLTTRCGLPHVVRGATATGIGDIKLRLNVATC